MCVLSPEPHSDALRAAASVYGSCELQDRGRQLHVVSRTTGSHAFPRDLRGSHPGDHGGDGEEVQDGVAPGEGHAAQRERVGKIQEDVPESAAKFSLKKIKNRTAGPKHGE